MQRSTIRVGRAKILSLIAAAAFASFAGAAPCEVQMPTAPEVNGRALTMELANGKIITVLGHTHGARDLQGKLLGVLVSPEMASGDLKVAAAPLLNALAKPLGEFRQDVTFLKAELARDPSLTLWEESSPMALAVINALLKIAAGKHAIADYDDAFLLAGNPILYMRLTGHVPSTATVSGLERITPEITQEEKGVENLKAGTLTFAELLVRDPRTFKIAQPFLKQWDAWLSNGKIDELLGFDVGEIEAAVKAGGFPPELAKPLHARMLAYLLEDQISIKRDRANVAWLVTSDRSGIFTVGLLHLTSTIALLEQACHKM